MGDNPNPQPLARGTVPSIDLPPFVKTYSAIVVDVHLCEKDLQLAVGNCEASAAEGDLKLLLR